MKVLQAEGQDVSCHVRHQSHGSSMLCMPNNGARKGSILHHEPMKNPKQYTNSNTLYLLSHDSESLVQLRAESRPEALKIAFLMKRHLVCPVRLVKSNIQVALS